MPGSAEDRRREERVEAAMPVSLGELEGVTCNVSASGMFFETSAVLESGSEIGFSVEFDAPEGKRVLRCRGIILRTEVRDDRFGIAVRITDSMMESSVAFRELRIAANNL